ncbi:nucleotidyltransferase family protein [Kribbella sp.]|uniref:nucleotidyltransferase family protein n=1 Tax=Kribbella sp. TaxID=1871183 RepID=UPI002D4EE55A|nr:nucleotidyltransferase family protein [Kribbella sp.]HZX05163.1 nucleotidyltransferase family protein [Kribbella sp.]
MKTPGRVAGLVLAAGAGRRMGTPKALIRDAAGVAWVVRTARLLAEAGCTPVVVVVGASADRARAELVGEPVDVVEAADWSEGMGASLRTGLTYLQSHSLPPAAASGSTPPSARSASGAGLSAEAAVVLPVDVPGLTVAALERVMSGAGADVLVRATYDGAPGHPVVIGRAHWDGVIASARGDEGARAYLRTHDAALVECADVADGADVDTADGLPPGHH